MKKILFLLAIMMTLSGCTTQVSDLPEAIVSPSAPSPTISVAPSNNSPEPTVTPVLSPSPSSSLLPTAIMYEQDDYKDKKAGFSIKYPKGWEISKPDGELVRFAGPIVNGSTGYAYVTTSKQKYSDLTKYDEYAKGIVEESNKDREVAIVQSAFIFTNEKKQGRFELISAINKADAKDWHIYYYFFLQLGNKIYKVVCFSNGPDFNTVFKAYTMLMSSLKD